ncbi:Flp family type IVb pilin [Granulicella sp. WH15]|uniref:Flp family type IVb pilin n=1 Tax=Granulicella sp. WH15 TaxID=2602070 RepID=UPI00136684CF|nr:Flp family type IVb pilin [Granulicella sp. WH15]QHN02687.1 Flp family type IVb pilin [Granulicella sp. WH15]
MNRILHHVTNLLKDESGQDLIEYALIASLISLAAITLMGTVATNIKTVFTNISNGLVPPS